MIASIRLILPEIFLSGSALFLLGWDAFIQEHLKKWVFWMSFFALAITFFLLIHPPQEGVAFGMLVQDPFSLFFKVLALFSAGFILLISREDKALMGDYAGTYVSLILFSVVGTMFLSSAKDLLMLFLGMELTTIPLFILAGFLRNDLRSSEGAIKFFLVGTLSTGLMLFGISYLYGLTGSTQFKEIYEWFNKTQLGNGDLVLFFLAILFLLAGLGFKLSLVPFHQWTPDTYEGAPTPITAFFSVSREAGVIVVTVRLFSEYLKQNQMGMTSFFALLSILTMTIGNIAALRQNNLKRLLAYSSIAHAGTIFIGLVAGNRLGREGIMLYSLAYFLMSLGAFSVVIYVSRLKNSEDISSIQGLSKENFPLSLMMLFFLLSLSGIPPFLGFWAKFYVFWAAIEAKLFYLVAIALLNAIIAVYYYFRIVHKMFFQEPSYSQPLSSRLERHYGLEFATLLAVSLLLLFGIFPQSLLSWIKGSSVIIP